MYCFDLLIPFLCDFYSLLKIGSKDSKNIKCDFCIFAAV